MEKKSKTLGFVIFLLVVAIVAIGAMGYYIFLTRTNENKEIVALREEMKILQEQNNNYQTALDNINKTIGGLRNNTEEEKESKNELKLGTYRLNEVIVDEAGVKDDSSITLLEDNKFELYMGWGAGHKGNYEIKDGKLICNSTKWISESGGYFEKDVDVTFTFEIKNDNLLKLSAINKKEETDSKIIWGDGITIGKTFSRK